MSVPHDEQPLTRRALRELERQKPRKQQKEEAKAAESASAESASAEGSAVAAPGSAPDAVVVPHAEGPETGATPVAPVGETPAGSTPTGSMPVAPTPTGSTPAGSTSTGPTPTGSAAPTLSRRARRALSADHPLAGSEIATTGVAPVHPEPDTGAVDTEQPTVADAAPVTGPIIAELVPEDLTTGATIVVEDAVPSDVAAPAEHEQVDDAVLIVEELVVVDETVAPEVSAQEDDEFAEIDDTQAPDAVHIITIDENPQAPVLAPLFQAPPPEREIVPAEAPNAVSKNSFDDLVGSRGVGSSNIASTSALVLPSIPTYGDVGTALDETGEVIITGSIDLPMSLGSTGAAPADGLESADLDAYLDPDGDVGSDVAPVSATRAVSTHGTSSGLVAPPKRGSATAPVILAVTAGVLAIGVVGLLLAAFVFRIF